MKFLLLLLSFLTFSLFSMELRKKEVKNTVSFFDQLVLTDGTTLKPSLNGDKLLLTEWKDGVCAEKCRSLDLYQIIPYWSNCLHKDTRCHGLAALPHNLIMALVVASETKKDDAIYFSIINLATNVSLNKVLRNPGSFSSIRIQAISKGNFIDVILKALIETKDNCEKYRYSTSFDPFTMLPNDEAKQLPQSAPLKLS